jgi:dienelactone hydrolase
MMRRLVAALLVMAAACSSRRDAARVATTSPSPSAPTSGQPTTAPAPPLVAKRPLATATTTVTFTDASRPTPATSAGPARPSRALPTTIWYPSDDAGPFPLVVWAHGYNRRGVEYASVLARWASAGYVVAAPTLPSSRRPASGEGPATSADQRAEPGDLAFVVGEVVRLGAEGTSPLRGRVDGRHVVAAGHSQGAADALAMAFASCCRDARVGAVVAIAGAELPGTFGAFGAGRGQVAALFEQGDADVHISVSTARSMYGAAVPPKFLLVLHGADHNTSLMDVAQPAARLLADLVVDFSDHYTKGISTVPQMDATVRAAPFAQIAHQE